MPPIMKVKDIAHVRFSAPDLAEMRAFLEDFGFEVFEQSGALFGKGGDGRPFLHATEQGAPGFKALGFQAQSLDELQALADFDKVEVKDLTDPGGGQVVRLRDPDGFLVEVVANQKELEASPTGDEIPHNSVCDRPRLRESIRLERGPSHIQRIGHCVLNVSDFRASEAWYKDRFGFLTSDEIEMAPGQAMGAFMRCDRGQQPTDHHTLFLAQLPQPAGFMHAAFEVRHLDDLMLGHTHLKQQGRDQAWGVGRHIMGSQVFDYWRDPWGHELEHWTDGDMFTADDDPNTMSFENLIDVQWGAPHPLVAARDAAE